MQTRLQPYTVREESFVFDTGGYCFVTTPFSHPLEGRLIKQWNLIQEILILLFFLLCYWEHLWHYYYRKRSRTLSVVGWTRLWKERNQLLRSDGGARPWRTDTMQDFRNDITFVLRCSHVDNMLQNRSTICSKTVPTSDCPNRSEYLASPCGPAPHGEYSAPQHCSSEEYPYR